MQTECVGAPNAGARQLLAKHNAQLSPWLPAPLQASVKKCYNLSYSRAKDRKQAGKTRAAPAQSCIWSEIEEGRRKEGALHGGQNRGGPESPTGSCKREGNGNFFLHLISLGISGAEKVLLHVRQNSANCKDGDEGKQRREYQETSV